MRARVSGRRAVTPNGLLRCLIAVPVSRLLACGSGCLGEFVEHSHDTELEVEVARTVTEQKGTDAWQPRRTLIGRSVRYSRARCARGGFRWRIADRTREPAAVMRVRLGRIAIWLERRIVARLQRQWLR